MFSFYKKHNNQLYNKLSDLSRNKFLYEEIKLADNFETRVLLIFFHLSIILKIAKGTGSNKKTQDIYDNIFQNIEYHIRELGYGDVSVNKNMKNMNKIFYDILYSLDKETSNTNISKKLLEKYFNPKNISSNVKISKLADYLVKFQNFCFDLDVNIMLNGSIDFKYR